MLTKAGATGVASVITMLVLSGFGTILYKAFATESTKPEELKLKLENQKYTINTVIKDLDDKYSRFTKSFSNIVPQKSLKEVEPKISENSLKQYFENDINKKELSMKKVEPPASNTAVNKETMNIELESDDLVEVLIKTKKTITENKKSRDMISNEVIATNAPIVKQVGLSLGSLTIEASVHQIENLFGETGRIGNLFIIQMPKQDPSKIDAFSIDFSEESKVKGFFDNSEKVVLEMEKKKKDEIATPLSTSSGYEYYLKNGDDAKIKTFLEEIQIAIKPVVLDNVDEINPYKWLYLATLLDNKVGDLKPIVVLLYSANTAGKNIIYPKDVNLFEKKWMEESDKILYSGCTKRIINHSKEFLPESEEIII